MAEYHIKEVKGRATRRLFHRVPFLIYENDDNFIPHLEEDIEAVFNKRLNIALQNGDTRRWVILDADNVPAGRIAVFHYTSLDGKHIGGAGFFECIEDAEVAKILFDTAESYLKLQGVHTMQAPVNCGERDRFWGLLIDGFDAPSYLQNYNPPYYKTLFENYGYQKDFEQHYYAVRPDSFPDDRFARIANRKLQHPDITVKHFTFENASQFIHDVTEVYNKAWHEQEFYKPLTVESATAMFQSLKMVIEPELLWVVYYKQNPAGAFLALRELNELFTDADGSLNWIDKIRLYFQRKKIPVTRIQSFMFGIVPEYRHIGMDAVLIHSMFQALKKYPRLDFMELAWIGDFNAGMMKLMKQIGAKPYKTLFTYKKQLS